MALTLFGGLEVTGAPQGVTVTGEARWLGCALEPYTEGIFIPTGLSAASLHEGCSDWADEWRGEVSRDRPNVAVLLIGAWDMFDAQVNGHRIVYGSRESDRWLSALLDEAIRTLGNSGAKGGAAHRAVLGPGVGSGVPWMIRVRTPTGSHDRRDQLRPFSGCVGVGEELRPALLLVTPHDTCVVGVEPAISTVRASRIELLGSMTPGAAGPGRGLSDGRKSPIRHGS
jgi:hypothetical protein